MHRLLTITFALSCATLFTGAGCSDDDDGNGGTAGTAGASGTGGASGTSGAAGTGGASGAAGTAGAAGAGGTSGAAGTGGSAGTASGDAAGGAAGTGDASAAAAEVVTCPASPNAEIVAGGAPPFSFMPATTTVSAGQVIRFRNSSAVVHDATSGMGGATPAADGKWDSGDIAAGASVCMRFNVPGTYPFYCSFHPTSMTGTITVQ
jgi:plastocyanin